MKRIARNQHSQILGNPSRNILFFVLSTSPRLLSLRQARALGEASKLPGGEISMAKPVPSGAYPISEPHPLASLSC